MLIGGMTQAESPEWMPAISMCSMIAGTKCLLAVGQRVGLALQGVVEEAIDVDRPLGGDLARRRQVSAEHLLVVDDFHAPPAQDVRGADDQRVADALWRSAAPLRRCWPCPRAAWGCQSCPSSCGTVAVLGRVDGVDRRAQDLHAVARRVGGRCSAASGRRTGRSRPAAFPSRRSRGHLRRSAARNRACRRCRSRCETVSGLQLTMMVS